MSGGAVLWAESPDEDERQDGPDSQAHGDVDETFAARRLRRWIRGMFGGRPKPTAEPGEELGREPEDSP
jgi:hypothetical protein